MKPDFLYHGSMYLAAELMPGFKRSGVLVKWDKIESNKYLYATTDKEEAKSLGFASAIEKIYGLDEYHTLEDGSISMKLRDAGVSLKDLGSLDVYVYTIPNKDDDHWVLNNNHFNNIENEYKTDRAIMHIGEVEKLDVVEWIKSKKIKIINSSPAFEAWK